MHVHMYMPSAVKGLNAVTSHTGTAGLIVIRDLDGNSTGMLKEPPAIALAVTKIPRPNAIEIARIALSTLQQYSQHGFTNITDMHGHN